MKAERPTAARRPSSIEQAIAFRDALRIAVVQANELIRSLKQQKREARLVQSTLASLRQLQKVAHQEIGEVVGQFTRQAKAFFAGTYTQGPNHLVDHLPEGKGGHVQLETTGFDARQIENLVQEMQEQVGGLAGSLEVVADAVRQGFLQRQIGHSNDGAHLRSPYLGCPTHPRPATRLE